jgi:hypothetical protein
MNGSSPCGPRLVVFAGMLWGRQMVYPRQTSAGRHFFDRQGMDHVPVPQRMDRGEIGEVLVGRFRLMVHGDLITSFADISPERSIGRDEEALQLSAVGSLDGFHRIVDCFAFRCNLLILGEGLGLFRLEFGLNDRPRAIVQHLAAYAVGISRDALFLQMGVGVRLSVNGMEVLDGGDYQRDPLLFENRMQSVVDLPEIAKQIIFRIIDPNPLSREDRTPTAAGRASRMKRQDLVPIMIAHRFLDVLWQPRQFHFADRELGPLEKSDMVLAEGEHKESSASMHHGEKRNGEEQSTDVDFLGERARQSVDPVVIAGGECGESVALVGPKINFFLRSLERGQEVAGVGATHAACDQFLFRLIQKVSKSNRILFRSAAAGGHEDGNTGSIMLGEQCSQVRSCQ